MREQYVIEGGRRLEGVVSVSGAKNAALPLIISTILTSEPCRLRNVPDLEDIAVTLRMLRMLGAKASFSGGVLDIETPSIADTVAPYSLVKALRASFWVLGPLLARVGEARVALPGGDAIGSRPVDLHLKGLAALGADIRFSQGAVVAHAPGKLKGAKINLEYPSVGATHHLLMTAALVPGETVLEGAAREPEVVALAELLSAMGAEIEGAGSSVVRIQGRSELGGAELRVIGDRIEAATYLIAGAMCAGNVTVDGISKDAMGATLDILSQMGASIEAGENSVAVCASDRLKAASFSTAPVPGLATDVQPLLMAAASIASGTSVITETVFDNRFGHVAEYRRLGADIELDGRTATVKGVDCLSGAPVEATDIRAAAGLVLMGLTAAGTTDLLEIHHLDRGYETLTDKFCSLGAVIRRTPIDEDRELVFGC
ncbi:MAG: UDP-N-acetylglucosamine 1-carboxyvinyltransferase [Bdellovibrionales bacterium]|nr:UDP-N-acetylglucosamine 1-carboxyvinyltransferase [Bdellovibrionales bacterium]